MIRRAQPWLGTMVEISAEGGHDALTDAFAAIARVHWLMSFHDAHSDVARINRAAPGDTVHVDRDTWEVLRIAAEVGRLSGGAFDVACAPRLVAWQVLPAPQAASPAILKFGEVMALGEKGAVRKLAPGWIDLGGIAKGYAVDLAVECLQRAGVGAGCVNAGGDLRVFGDLRLPVSIRSPRNPGMAAAVLELEDGALATSGSYFSAREVDGMTASALVDPRDGSAIVSERSASVRAPRCVLADALTKVVLATGDVHHPALSACEASAFLI